MFQYNPFTGKLDIVQDVSSFITGADVPTYETDPVFSAWLLATPPIYSETDPVWLADKPSYLTSATAASTYLKLDASNDPITGDLKLTPTANSTSTFQIFQQGGTNIVFNVDTTNKYVGVGTATPGAELEVKSTRTTGYNPFLQISAGKSAGQAASVGFTRPLATQQALFAFETTTSGNPDGYFGTMPNKQDALYILTSNGTGSNACVGIDNTLGLRVGSAANIVSGAVGFSSTYDGKVYALTRIGIGTSSTDRQFEINTGAATGGMRLTYNDNDGSATIYNDFLIDSSGVLTIKSTANTFTFDTIANTDLTFNFNGTTNSGQLKWMEDEDYFNPLDDFLFPLDERVYFGDTNVSIYSNDDGYLDLEADTGVRTNNYIRHTSANYRRYYHLALGSANPGASGATWVEAGANTTGGWRLTNAAWLLRAQTDIHSDWDGASNPTFHVNFMVNVDNTAGGVGDTVDLKATIYYKGLGDTATKSQVVEVPVTVGQSPQYKQFDASFTVDWDAVSNVLEIGDVVSIILNLETDTSEVDDIVITSMEFYYPTKHLGIESGDV